MGHQLKKLYKEPFIYKYLQRWVFVLHFISESSVFRGACAGKRQIEADRGMLKLWHLKFQGQAQLCVACSYFGFKCVWRSTGSETSTFMDHMHTSTVACHSVQLKQQISASFYGKGCEYGTLTWYSCQLLPTNQTSLPYFTLPDIIWFYLDGTCASILLLFLPFRILPWHFSFVFLGSQEYYEGLLLWHLLLAFFLLVKILRKVRRQEDSSVVLRD